MMDTFTITNPLKGKLASLPFVDMKNAVLGTDYELSLVFLNEKEMHELNKNYHGKDKPTNILSFPLTKNSGEIFICPDYAKKEASDFDRTFDNYLQFLFIHGLLHLKGMTHGSRMEAQEQKIRALFNV